MDLLAENKKNDIEKKIWTKPYFVLISKDKIKTGTVPKPFSETPSYSHTYVS
jgi:hypothetical protein